MQPSVSSIIEKKNTDTLLVQETHCRGVHFLVSVEYSTEHIHARKRYITYPVESSHLYVSYVSDALTNKCRPYTPDQLFAADCTSPST